jgi:SAM-dependent methyltransferase
MSALNVLYAIAIFLGSFLLFLVEPMAAKRLVPLLGGSAAVWTTCLVFFQSALLAGYLCAHWMATRLRQRFQALAFTGLLAVCVVQAVLALRPDLEASTDHPILSVFRLLATLIGLPFLALSATNPLLQDWYARGATRGTPSPHGAHATAPPYRLFALSNFGSLLALVIYPWIIEPRFSLRAQSQVWLAGFIVFVLACAGIAWLKITRTRESVAIAEPAPNVTAAEAKPPIRHRILWLLLAACGSLLLCAMTTHLTQNIAAIPLLWIVPLIMYLLSFIVAFSRGQWLPRVLRHQIPLLKVSIGRMMVLGLTAVTLGALVYMLDDSRAYMPLIASVPFYCSALFITCLFCHAELHRLRPSPSHATSFYLLIAAGGALGSIFVGIVAPVIFSGNYELACGVVFTSLMVLAVTWDRGIGWRIFWAAASLAIAGVLLAAYVRGDTEHTVARVRNFYGSLRVTNDMEPPFPGVTRILYNGTIRHGTQIFTEQLRTTPTTYYSRDSGVGLALDLCCGERPRRVGIIGLGAGTLAAYGRKGDVFRFYDINPLVQPIARHWFTYLTESAATIEVVPGDARLSLSHEPPQAYDVLVIDAFSGDAIPVHLLTREAVALYRRHLAPGGIIAFHVSNKYLDLVPVVHQQAERAGLLDGYVVSLDDEENTGAYAADWVLVTDNADFLSKDQLMDATQTIDPKPGLRPWTDDYNSLLPILRWVEPKSTDSSDESQDTKQPGESKKPEGSNTPQPH